MTSRWLAGAAALVVLAVAAVLLVGARRDDDAGTAATAAPPAPRVVGYFAGWGVYGRDYQVKDVDTSGAAARLTHLVYAFGTVAGGRCALGDAWADVRRPYPAGRSVDGVADAGGLRGTFGQLRKLKARHPHLTLVWSFGGWTGSAGFSAAARNPAAFAASCKALVDDPRWAGLFAGVDLDWEYPNACGLRCDTSGRDALAALAGALRTAFGPDRLVTAAVPADARKLAAADYAGAARHLDWLAAMTYDFAGTGDTPGPTAPHSPLSAYPGAARPEATTEAAVGRLTALGIPPGKVLLGIGFYGRGWTGVTGDAPGGAATGAARGPRERGNEDNAVLARRSPPTGEAGGTGYARCGAEWWSYDTPATVAAKMAFARRQGLGGAFAWELSGDTATGDLLGAMAGGLS